jgi:hypothetical protein
VKTLISLALCVLLSSALASAQPALSDDDIAKLISNVKRTAASQLDPVLPPVTFEKWLRLQVGRDAAIAWAVRGAGDSGHSVPRVEADISEQGRPGIVILIACGTSDAGTTTKPKFSSMQLVRADDYADWPHLRDLPAALRRARDGAR